MVYSTIQSTKLHASNSTARRCFEQEGEPRVADAAEPAFLAASLPSRNDADAGAEQWYKTIAKLMQGRNIISTQTSEPRV